MKDIKTTNSSSTSDLRLAAIYPRGGIGLILRVIGPLLDRLLGIKKLRRLYERHNLAGLEKYHFLDQMIAALKLDYRYNAEELKLIPREGPVILVANHPLGGLEGVLLASILRHVRPDYKIFVNIVQRYICELEDFFIFTNPMFHGSKENFNSLSQARKWISARHCFLIFPAGRVGVYRPEKGYVTDEFWDQVALSLSQMVKAPIVPIFVSGSSSRLFNILSRHIYPMKLFMLVHEFLSSFGKRIEFYVGKPVSPERFKTMSRVRANAWLRMLTYLQAPIYGDAPDRVAAKAQALRQAAKHRPQPYRLRKRCPQEHPLHPEVEDYVRKYGLSAAELDELIARLK